MLTISSAMSVSQAFEYFLGGNSDSGVEMVEAFINRNALNSQSNSSSKIQLNENIWGGELAKHFHLENEVKKEDFEKVLNGINPKTVEKLIRHRARKNKKVVENNKSQKQYFEIKKSQQNSSKNKHSQKQNSQTSEHRAGWDLTFSAPKSVSLVAIIGNDTRLILAHREAVSVALKEVEKYAEARLGGNKPTQKTGKLLIASFAHYTARPDKKEKFAAVDLHTHNVVMNFTFLENGKSYSLQPKKIFEAQKLGTAVYRLELAKHLNGLGYQIRIDEKTKAPEIKNISREYIEAVSPRQNEIKVKAKELGINLTRGIAARYRSAKSEKSTDSFQIHQKLEEKFDHQAVKAVQFSQTNPQVEQTEIIKQLECEVEKLQQELIQKKVQKNQKYAKFQTEKVEKIEIEKVEKNQYEQNTKDEIREPRRERINTFSINQRIRRNESNNYQTTDPNFKQTNIKRFDFNKKQLESITNQYEREDIERKRSEGIIEQLSTKDESTNQSANSENQLSRRGINQNEQGTGNYQTGTANWNRVSGGKTRYFGISDKGKSEINSPKTSVSTNTNSSEIFAGNDKKESERSNSNKSNKPTETNNSANFQTFESDNSQFIKSDQSHRTSTDTEESIQNSSFNETSTPKIPRRNRMGSRKTTDLESSGQSCNENWQPRNFADDIREKPKLLETDETSASSFNDSINFSKFDSSNNSHFSGNNVCGSNLSNFSGNSDHDLHRNFLLDNDYRLETDKCLSWSDFWNNSHGNHDLSNGFNDHAVTNTGGNESFQTGRREFEFFNSFEFTEPFNPTIQTKYNTAEKSVENSGIYISNNIYQEVSQIFQNQEKQETIANEVIRLANLQQQSANQTEIDQKVSERMFGYLMQMSEIYSQGTNKTDSNSTNTLLELFAENITLDQEKLFEFTEYAKQQTEIEQEKSDEEKVTESKQEEEEEEEAKVTEIEQVEEDFDFSF